MRTLFMSHEAGGASSARRPWKSPVVSVASSSPLQLDPDLAVRIAILVRLTHAVHEVVDPAGALAGAVTANLTLPVDDRSRGRQAHLGQRGDAHRLHQRR